MVIIIMAGHVLKVLNNQNDVQETSGFEIYLAIRSKHVLNSFCNK